MASTGHARPAAINHWVHTNRGLGAAAEPTELHVAAPMSRRWRDGERNQAERRTPPRSSGANHPPGCYHDETPLLVFWAFKAA
jgi:hypothetical protein